MMTHINIYIYNTGKYDYKTMVTVTKKGTNVAKITEVKSRRENSANGDFDIRNNNIN